MKHLTTRTSPFELALWVEPRQLMDLAIPKVKRFYCEGNINAEQMTKEGEERKSWAIKLLEKVLTIYEK
jgi:hypothetical protein